MQSISHTESREGAKSSIGKRAVMVLAALLVALTVNVTEVKQAESGILGGALIGGIFGGGRGAVAGAIVGGLFGMSKRKKRKRRRW